MHFSTARMVVLRQATHAVVSAGDRQGFHAARASAATRSALVGGFSSMPITLALLSIMVNTFPMLLILFPSLLLAEVDKFGPRRLR